jgi:hypothetical protein
MLPAGSQDAVDSFYHPAGAGPPACLFCRPGAGTSGVARGARLDRAVLQASATATGVPCARTPLLPPACCWTTCWPAASPPLAPTGRVAAWR